MLLNYAAPRLAPNIVTAPKSNVDINAILGLAPSQYEGLQKVGDTGYFYGNNRMYEAYTPPPPPPGSYYGLSAFVNRAQTQPPFYGMNPVPKPSYEEVTIDGQRFRTVKPELAGFNRRALSEDDYQKDSVYEYSPSMAYVYANTPRPAPVQTPNQMAFLSSPTPSVSYNGNYGAGRFLNTGNLLGFNFGTPSGQTTGGQATP